MSLRHIGGNCYLGDTFAPAKQDWDYVVTLEAELNTHTTHHIPLVDDEDHSREQFIEAVSRAAELLERDSADSVLIHCTAGINRSGAVGAVVWTLVSDDGIGQALSKCKCGFHNIAPYFEQTARSVYKELSTPDDK